MFKGFVSDVSKEVGKSAAIMINQLFQWWKSNNKSKIYRTNQELHNDLCGVLSIATIQRCKMKLIDKGYVEVSYDKGLNRVTHYKLTEKALALLNTNKQPSEAITTTLTKSGSSVPPKDNNGSVAPVDGFKRTNNAVSKHNWNNAAKYNRGDASKQEPSIHTPADNPNMKENFEEYGKKLEGVVKGVPSALKAMLGKKTTPNETKEETHVVAAKETLKNDAYIESCVEAEYNLTQDEYNSVDDTDDLYFDEDFDACITMMEQGWGGVANNTIQQNEQTQGKNLSDMLSSVFKNPVTKGVAMMYEMQQQREMFKEDY